MSASMLLNTPDIADNTAAWGYGCQTPDFVLALAKLAGYPYIGICGVCSAAARDLAYDYASLFAFPRLHQRHAEAGKHTC
jgi:hypothetical protein